MLICSVYQHLLLSAVITCLIAIGVSSKLALQSQSVHAVAQVQNDVAAGGEHLVRSQVMLCVPKVSNDSTA